MSTPAVPIAIQCAELAARRELAAVRRGLKGRTKDLASIAASAALVGFFGTVLGILNSFRSSEGSLSSILAATAGGISQAMTPGALGLVVALLAFWGYRSLSDQVRAFELEMESVTVDLVNGLVLYLARLKNG